MTSDDAGAPAGAPAHEPSVSFLVRLREEYFAKGAKYIAVSAFNVVFGQGLLFGFQAMGVEPWIANMLAVSISAVPAFLLSKYWVWQKSGTSQLMREVVPFWGLALLGFVLSTYAVRVVTDVFDGDPPKLVVNATNLAAFGVIWVGKFFILDKILFAKAPSAPEDADTAA